MWAFWITHMNAYLCAILCLVIGVEGNIQKQWGDYELEVLCTNFFENYLGINPWVYKKQQKKPHIRNTSINIIQTLDPIGSKTKYIKNFLSSTIHILDSHQKQTNNKARAYFITF